MKIAFVAIAVMAMACPSGAASFTRDGAAGSAIYGYNYGAGDRNFLVDDGSFENGCGVDWTCESDNTCVWIADLVPLGLWNYDGSMVAWLGGFCGGLATCYSEICQRVWLDDWLTWKWMAYVNDAVTTMYVAIDGVRVYNHVFQLDEHLLDYEQELLETVAWSGSVELCFGADNDVYCWSNQGDNWFVDYVETTGIGDDPTAVPLGPGALAARSISTVKALY